MVSITDLYKQLFGRHGPAEGSVIDMAEHGRAGGTSTGTPFKGIQEIPLQVIVDESNANKVYVGEANHGVATSTASWRVRQVLTTNSITYVQYADGDDEFDNIYDNRASLSYS